MRFTHLLNPVTALSVVSGAILLTALPLVRVAQANPEPISISFAAPTFEREPIPEDLNTAEAWQTVGMNAYLAQDYLNSIAAYSKAIDLSLPNSRPELFEERGWVYYSAGNLDAATEDFQSAADLYATQDRAQSLSNVNQMKQFVEQQVQRFDQSNSVS